MSALEMVSPAPPHAPTGITTQLEHTQRNGLLCKDKGVLRRGGYPHVRSPALPPVFARAWFHEGTPVADGDENFVCAGRAPNLPGAQGRQLAAARIVGLPVARQQ